MSRKSATVGYAMSILKRLDELWNSAQKRQPERLPKSAWTFGNEVSHEVEIFIPNEVVALYLDSISFVEMLKEWDGYSLANQRVFGPIDRSVNPPTFRGRPIYRVQSNITHMYVAVEAQ